MTIAAAGAVMIAVIGTRIADGTVAASGTVAGTGTVAGATTAAIIAGIKAA